MIYTVLFINIFVIYLFTLFPTIAAYRDAGEFATVGYILGVGHPPGYPLYSLIIYLFGRVIPFGNFAYRLNIFSAIVSSLTATTILYFFMLSNSSLYKENSNKKFIAFVGYLLSLLFSVGYLQWYLSLVSEMYTLNTLFAVLILLLGFLYFMQDRRVIYFLYFLFGLGLANRLDLVLFVPLIIFVGVDFLKLAKKKINTILVLSMLFLLGSLCYVYLPLRSRCEPFIDWNNPEEPIRFLNSLLRKTHGSTLDLISAGYKSGENFFDGLKLYFSYLIKNVSFVNVFVILLGIKKTFNFNKSYALALIFSWSLSCIYFIYKANMPPNPHAMAILEAHFLLPNIVVYVWMIFGMKELVVKFNSLKTRLIMASFLICLICYNIFSNMPRLNKRNNFYAYDYTVNLFRSVPKESIVIIKEDVQLFSCWYRKFVENVRPKVCIIASGLSGSEWYQKMIYNFLKRSEGTTEIFVSKITEGPTLLNFVNENLARGYRIFITPDVELGITKELLFIPQNFLTEITIENKELDVRNLKFFYDEIYIFRGRYVYDLDWEFFSSDLIEDYSRSLLNCGHWFVRKGLVLKEVKQLYKFSISMNPTLPFSYFNLGYIFFLQNQYEESLQWYKTASVKFETYLNLARKYKASDDVIKNITQQSAVCWLHLGVVYERLNKIDEAIDSYQKSLELDPYFVDAYYNLACVYWRKQDWKKVAYYLSEVLRLNPHHEEAKYYFERIPK